MSRKVIITCAVTGAIHTPSMSKALAVTRRKSPTRGRCGGSRRRDRASARPQPEDRQPDQSPDAFCAVPENHQAALHCVIKLTTGGAPTMTVDERVRPAGSTSRKSLPQHGIDEFCPFFGMLNRFKKFEHDWELSTCKQGHVFRNYLPGHRICVEDAVGDRHAAFEFDVRYRRISTI